MSHDGVRHGAVVTATRESVGNCGEMRDFSHRHALQRKVEGRGVLRLHGRYLDVGATVGFSRNERAGDQPAAADADDQVFQRGSLVQHLFKDGGLTGHNIGVVKGREKTNRPLGGQREGKDLGVVVGVAVLNEVNVVTT